MTIAHKNGASQSLPFRHAPAAILTQEIGFTIEDITPERAKVFLASNFARNRPVRRSRVERYKRLIADGDWRVTHQGIAFDKDGRLIDGQHRLTALSEMPTGSSARLTVARYVVDTRALSTLDIGASRLAGDAIVVEGMTDKDNGKNVAAVANAIGMGLRRSQSTLDHQAVLDTYTSFQQETDWAISTVHGRKMIAPVVGAFAYAYPVSPERVEAIARSVVTAIGLTENSGELAIRAFIDNGLHAKNNGGTVRGPGAHRLEVFYKILGGIRHAIEGKSTGKLQGPRQDADGPPSALMWFAKRRQALGLHTGLAG